MNERVAVRGKVISLAEAGRGGSFVRENMRKVMERREGEKR